MVALLVLIPRLAPDRVSVLPALGLSLLKAGSALVLLVAVGRYC